LQDHPVFAGAEDLMAVPGVAAALIKTGAHKPIVKAVGASLGALVGAALIAVPMFLTILGLPAGTVAPLGGGPLIVGQWGVPEVGYTVTAGFGYVDRSDCSVCSEFHRGVDLSAGCGQPVFAAGPGTVSVAGWDGSGYGNRIIVDHGGGYISMYGHMPDGGIRVTVGQTVTAGDQLGIEGSTGKSTGCHLHFEIRSDGQSVDPLAFMLERGIAI
jgi:murein DD-endopeptidase MepM/ murein hydrolase activator NlpD